MKNLLILIPQLLREVSKEKDIEDLKFTDFHIKGEEYQKASHVVYQDGKTLFLMKSSIIPKSAFITERDLQALMQGKVPVDVYQDLLHEGKAYRTQAIRELKELGIDVMEEFHSIHDEHISKYGQQPMKTRDRAYRIDGRSLYLLHNAYRSMATIRQALLMAYMEMQTLPFDSLEDTFARYYLVLLNKHKQPEVAVAS